MLPGVCPGCGLRADLDVFAVQADANAALAAALALPAPLGGRVLNYLRLFSPPQKVLAARKATRLLEELAQAIRSAQVQRRGVVRAAPLEVWAAALDAVLAQPPEVLPLAGHAYLFQVAWNLVERASARQERQAEDRLRQGARPSADSSTAPVASSSGAASSPAASPIAVAEAFSSPAPADRPARQPAPAEFRALLGQLSKALVVPAAASAPAAPPTKE